MENSRRHFALGEACVSAYSVGMQRAFLQHVRRLLSVPLLMFVVVPPAIAAKKEPAANPLLLKVAEYHLKHARQGAAAAALDDAIYVFGGFAGGALGSIERLDINTGTVEVVTSKASARRYHAAIEHNGRFYLYGGEGHTLDGGYESMVEVFDPRTKSVTQTAEMPAALAGMAAVKIADKVYFLGGQLSTASGQGWSRAVIVYDFTTGKWARLPDVPVALEAKAVEVDSYIVVLGGYDGRANLDSVLAFSPSENGWRELPSLPRRVSANSAAKLGDYVFLFGDFYKRNQVLAYDLTNLQTLELKTDFKGARHSAAVVHRNRIYVIGGNQSTTGRDESDLIQVFELNPAYVKK